MNQTTNNLIMIQPKHFGYNIETSRDNYYQKNEIKMPKSEIKKKAKLEFDHLVLKIEKNGINIKVFKDKKSLITTDSIFPNNWISLHEEGKLITYPMYSKNRRQERRKDIIENYLKKNYLINELIDLSHWEEKGNFLEGTGSMVFDRKNKLCYAAISKRTSKKLLNQLCKTLNYKLYTFKANQTYKGKRVPIYHTNVMMSIGKKFAIVCLDSIDDKKEKEGLIFLLTQTNKKIIYINESQIENFAGNILEVKNNNEKGFIIMSSRAYKCLKKDQKKKLENYGTIIHSNLDTIEKIGGGSARCMIAENFLKKKNKK